MHKFLWIIFIFSLNGSTCFGLSLVHHHEQHLISCTVQLVHLCQYVWLLYGYRKDFLYPYSSQMYRHKCTNCTVQLIKCCSWWWTNDSPKHVQPFNDKERLFATVRASRWFKYTLQYDARYIQRQIVQCILHISANCIRTFFLHAIFLSLVQTFQPL